MRLRNAILSGAVVFMFMVQFMPLQATFAATVPGPAVGLVVTLLPPKLPACVPSIQCRNPSVVVSLIDKNNLPSVALSDIPIYLSSSLPNIAYFPNFPSLAPYQTKIPAGMAYVVVNITTTATPGNTEITATSTGLTPATAAQLSTVEPSGFPDKLAVFASPGTFLAGSSLQGIVRAELLDDSGLPSKAIVPVTVFLTSSNTSIARLSANSLTIPAGQLYTSESFTSGRGGQGQNTAVITASATGFKSGDTSVSIAPNSCSGPCTPVGIALKLLSGGSSGNLPADGNNYDALEVSLINSGGGPALAPATTLVQLSTSKSEVVDLQNDLVTVTAGQESTIAVLKMSALEGTATITATSSGLLPQTVDVTTFIPAPSKLGLYIAPPSISSYPGQLKPLMVVQLQDNSGNPARARQTTSIVVNPTNKSMVKNPVSLSIGVGSDYKITPLTAVGTGPCTLTAITQGLSYAQGILNLAPSPLVVSLSDATPLRYIKAMGVNGIFTNQTAQMTVTVTLLGSPLKGFNVQWGVPGSMGSMAPSSSANANGSASSTFNPRSNGVANITATVSSSTIPSQELFYILYVGVVPPKPTPSILATLLSLWYYIVAAVVVAAIAIYYLLRMRRKKQRAEIEAGFEVV